MSTRARVSRSILPVTDAADTSTTVFSNATLLEFTDVFSGKAMTLSVTDSHTYTDVDGEKCHVYDVRLDGGGGRGTLVARILRPRRSSSKVSPDDSRGTNNKTHARCSMSSLSRKEPTWPSYRQCAS